jgi:hypothetical protein
LRPAARFNLFLDKLSRRENLRYLSLCHLLAPGFGLISDNPQSP